MVLSDAMARSVAAAAFYAFTSLAIVFVNKVRALSPETPTPRLGTHEWQRRLC
jgi:hypothetical protein